MLKLKLQYFGHWTGRTDSFEKTLMLGKIEGGRRSGWQRMRWLDGNTGSMHLNLSKLWSWWWTGKPRVLQSMGSKRVGHKWATELNWSLWASSHSDWDQPLFQKRKLDLIIPILHNLKCSQLILIMIGSCYPVIIQVPLSHGSQIIISEKL